MHESQTIITANEEFLRKHGGDLQANIFLSRRKNFVEMLFLQFNGNDDHTALKSFLSMLAANSETAMGIHLTSYDNQLAIRTGTQHHRSLFCNLYLTHRGLSKLLEHEDLWSEIRGHLGANRQDLDWNLPHLDPNYQDEERIDAVLVLGHNVQDALPRWRRFFSQQIFPRIGVNLLFHEETRIYRNNLVGNNRERGLVVEHFGYADGASNPCITEKEFQKFGPSNKSMDEWNPVSSVHEFVVVEPEPANSPSFGSYLVLRKMSQDVNKFNTVLKDIADKMNVGKTEEEVKVRPEEVGAIAFGRRRNGTSLEKDAIFDHRTLNDFHYPKDGKCPFFAHARKMNDRESGTSQELPKKYQTPNPIIRRGITYGKRALKYGGLDAMKPPKGEVGLIFMSFQKDINQYQAILANAIEGPELDPILGNLDQPDKSFEHQIPGLTETYQGFGDFVKLLGGLNLYAPSLSFFTNLSTPVS